MKAVIGKNIRKAGIFKKPILKGKLAFRYEPDIKKPTAPNKAIINPIAAAFQSLLIGYQRTLKLEHS